MKCENLLQKLSRAMIDIICDIIHIQGDRTPSACPYLTRSSCRPGSCGRQAGLTDN